MGEAEVLAELAQAMAPSLQPGETLNAVCMANDARTFSSTSTAIGVTDRRLLVQPTDRRWRPDGDLRPVTADDIASLRVDGAGEGWLTTTAALASSAAVTVRLKTHDGRKHKFMLMGGGGLLADLLASEHQRSSTDALLDWIRRHQPS